MATDESVGSTASLETPQDAGPGDAGVVRRWLLELKLADEREKEWRELAQKVWDRYKAKAAKKASFNILWANTEVLRPAIYNSLPKPDVRRRFRDADPLAKAVSQVLERGIFYSLDSEGFDQSAKSVCLDLLLPGRGVTWERYFADIRKVRPTLDGSGSEEETQETADRVMDRPEVGEDNVNSATPSDTVEGEAGGEEMGEGYDEDLDYERSVTERVQWDDFRQGPGKTWGEVPWVARRHRMDRDDLIDKFGDDIGGKVQLDESENTEIKKEKSEAVKALFKTAVVWEIWSKTDKKVYFIAPSMKDAPCKVDDDPLELRGFFPCPEPCRAVEDSSSQVPIPLYELYREQAEELDEISARISKVMRGIKATGIYNATLKDDLKAMMDSPDNMYVPSQNVAHAAQSTGGDLSKAIWSNPIKERAEVLKILYEQRDQIKNTIYEILGIADIMRGSTDPDETLGAQQMKAGFGSQRLKNRQREFARYIRDVLCLKAEIIAKKFSPETLQKMTGLQLPTAQQKAQVKQQLLMAQQGGPPAPEDAQDMLKLPTWEDVMGVLRDECELSFRVDIETDSTIQATLEGDIMAIQALMKSVTEFIQGIGPAVQAGAMPIEAVKEIILAFTRRAKLGIAVEDALEKMQQPAPPPQEAPAQTGPTPEEIQLKQQELAIKDKDVTLKAQTEQAKAAADLQAQREKLAADAVEAQKERDHALTIKQTELQHAAMQAQADREHQARQAATQQVYDHTFQANQSDKERAFQREDKEADRARQAQEKEQGAQRSDSRADVIVKQQQALAETLANVHKYLGSKKRIVRNPDGTTHVEPVN